jgi:hypothetical protein
MKEHKCASEMMMMMSIFEDSILLKLVIGDK